MHNKEADNIAVPPKAAFDKAYKAYASLLYSIALRLAPNETVAAEILSTAFVSAFMEINAGTDKPLCTTQLIAAIFNSAASILIVHFSSEETQRKILGERERLLGCIKHDLINPLAQPGSK